MSERTTGASLEAVVAEACRTYNGLRNPRHGPAVDPDAVAGLAMLIEAKATQAGARVVTGDDLAVLRRLVDVARAALSCDNQALRIYAHELRDADLDRLAALTEARP